MSCGSTSTTEPVTLQTSSETGAEMMRQLLALNVLYECKTFSTLPKVIFLDVRKLMLVPSQLQAVRTEVLIKMIVCKLSASLVDSTVQSVSLGRFSPWKIWYRDPLQPQAVDPDQSCKYEACQTKSVQNQRLEKCLIKAYDQCVLLYPRSCELALNSE